MTHPGSRMTLSAEVEDVSACGDAAEWTDDDAPSDSGALLPKRTGAGKSVILRSDRVYVSAADIDYGDVDDEAAEEARIAKETVFERICALKYMIPLCIRVRCRTAYRFFFAKSFVVAAFVGKFSWVLTTSLLLVGLPMFIEYDKEQTYVAYEKEQKMQAASIEQLAPSS